LQQQPKTFANSPSCSQSRSQPQPEKAAIVGRLLPVATINAANADFFNRISNEAAISTLLMQCPLQPIRMPKADRRETDNFVVLQ
jgi:hypothetical protein